MKPEGYKALLDMRQTEIGIKMIKRILPAKPEHRAPSVSRYRSALRIEGFGYQ